MPEVYKPENVRLLSFQPGVLRRGFFSRLSELPYVRRELVCPVDALLLLKRLPNELTNLVFMTAYMRAISRASLRRPML